MKILNVKPYNDLWIDCIDNNLIGILTVYDRGFNNLLCFYLGNYEINIQQNYGSTQTSHLDVSFTRPDLTSFFEEKVITVSAEDNIQEIIHQLLDDNFYIFLNIDRFYFPGSSDYNKSSFVHPTFVYGYNNRGYKLLEDCVKGGTVDYYEIDNENFTKSFNSTIEISNQATIHCVRLKNDSLNVKKEISREYVISTLNMLLQTETQSNESGSKYKGLISVKKYAELFTKENVQLIVQPEQFMTFFKQIKRGVTLQKRNLLILEDCHEFNLIEETAYNQLKDLYKDHHNQWEIVANKIGWLMYKNSEKFLISKSKELQEMLIDLYNREINLTKKFLSSIQKK